MKKKIKNRLVGILILILISISILPSLLNNKKEKYKREFTAISLIEKPEEKNDREDILFPIKFPLQSQLLKNKKFVKKFHQRVPTK